MNPSDLLRRWLRLANANHARKAEAFCLSTVDEDGTPQSRMMLINSITRGGIVFCTDARSKKAAEFFINPKAAGVIYWPELQRQIRIVGSIEAADDSFADSDFMNKTDGQKLIITMCNQSAVLKHCRRLEREFTTKLKRLNKSKSIHRPDFWKAYLLKATRWEFFIGGKERLNKRLLLTVNELKGWSAIRLFP